MANVLDRIRDALGRKGRKATPVASGPTGPRLSLKERMEGRFEAMMQEVDDLSKNESSLEEKAEYGWISIVRFLLPLVLFAIFGYEDGLFMTGFRYFSTEPPILIMYVIGYCLEALRVAMVYSMNFSKIEGRKKAFNQQFAFWVVMSLGCGIAQLSAAIVIQALGAEAALAGDNTLASGAKVIMAHIPFLVYVAIAIRVGLCAIADWACSGYLHKKKETIEQKVAVVTTKATNFQAILQANNNAQTIIDNARHYQEMIQDERAELKELRGRQKELSDMAFRAGMKEIRTHIEVDADPPRMLGRGDDDEE